MRMDAPGPRAGVSLVELMATLAVLAILLGLTLPTFRETLRRHRTAVATHQLAAQLAQARNTAISRRTPVTVCPSTGDGRCLRGTDWSHGWVLYRDPGRRDQPRRPDDILRVVPSPFHDSVRVSATPGRFRVRYQPDGRSGGNNLTLKLCADGELRSEIVVNNVGRVRTRRIHPPRPCPTS